MILELSIPSLEHPLTMAVPTDSRLAELIRDLTDCSPGEAGWSITAARDNASDTEDPLATVARAMVLLRHQSS